MAHGWGVCRHPDGSRYVGEWVAGQRHGKGRQDVPDGGYYDGDWSMGKRDGKGTCFEPGTALKVSTCYDGGFVQNFREGRGKLTLGTLVKNGQVVSHGCTLIGTWCKGIQNGSGIMESPGVNLKYIGKFKNGLLHGKGILSGRLPIRISEEFLSPPTKQNGMFKEGSFMEGTITFENGDKYQGSFAVKTPMGKEFCIGEGFYTRADGYKCHMVFHDDGTLNYHSVD